MSIKTYTFNPFSTNCFIGFSKGQAAIVDPSCQTDAEIETVIQFIRSNDLSVRHLLLTHAHIDHIFGCAALSEEFGLGIQMHSSDAILLENAVMQAEMFGLEIQPIGPPSSLLSEGDRVSTGDLYWDVIHTPGHSPGSVSFVDHVNKYVIAGDVIFRGSIGRTDLWQGSLPVLMQSIFQKIVPLGDTYSIYPGHGPATTVGVEKATNPFLLDGGSTGL